MNLLRSSWFSREAGDGVATSQAFRNAAFSDDVILDGLNSEVIEIDVDTMTVMRKSDYRDSTLRPLADVKSQILEDLSARTAFQALEDIGKRFVEELNNNKIQWSDWIATNAFKDESYSESASGDVAAIKGSIDSIMYNALPPSDTSPVFGSNWVNDQTLIVYQ